MHLKTQQRLVSAPLWTAVVLVGLFMIFPVIAIIPMSLNEADYLGFPPKGLSLRWYEEFFESPDWKSALFVSLRVAIYTMVFSLGLGVPASFAIVRGKFPGKQFITTLCALPIVFPVIVSAVALYYFFGPLKLVGTELGLALSHTTLALPVVILPTIAALRRFDMKLEWQARNLGATKFKVFTTVTLPILKPAFFTAAIFAFITSFDEIIFAIFLGSGRKVSLPKEIWEGWRFQLEPTIAVIASFLVIGIALLIASQIVIAFRHEKQSH